MDGILMENLCKYYSNSSGEKFCALQTVNLRIASGEFVSLVGESGCGKSTLARILIGAERPDSGKLLLDGEDTTTWTYHQWRLRRHKLQAVFQDAAGTLNPCLSAYKNVEIALASLTKLSRSQRRDRILELMERTNMREELLEVPVRQLSGGEQRRLALLRALSINPSYLVLDEVISGLDLISSHSVLSLLGQYHKELGCACLFITHDRDSAYRVSDRIIEMRQGSMILEGSRKGG